MNQLSDYPKLRNNLFVDSRASEIKNKANTGILVDWEDSLVRHFERMHQPVMSSNAELDYEQLCTLNMMITFIVKSELKITKINYKAFTSDRERFLLSESKAE